MFQRQFIASQRFKCFSHLQLRSSVTAAISSLELTFECVRKHVSFTNRNESVPPDPRFSYTSTRLLRACLLLLHERSNRILSSTMLKLLSDWLYTKHSKVFHCLEYSEAVRHSHDINLDRTSFHTKKPGSLVRKQIILIQH